MKYLLLTLFAFLLLHIEMSGGARHDPNRMAQGVVCVDIVEKLNSLSQSGNKVLISQCCGGIKLFAKVKIQRIGATSKTVTSKWVAEDAKGAALKTDVEQRTRTVSVKGIKEKLIEQLLVIRSENLCFVVAQKRQILN